MTKDINFAAIEKKWQDKWEKEKVFEANPDKRKKFFLNFPYPYINAFQHIGHLFTLMRVEALARYKRLQGFNVLFPQGWHATGSPIINAAKRVKEKEPKQLKIMNDMGFSGKDLKHFEDPKYWLEFFIPEFESDYKSIGMSVDWRREFHTTDLNPYYSKFIEWQFRKLKEKKYCVQGKFPVVWDPVQESAVGDHDRIEGEGVTTQDFIWGKFRMKDSDLILMAGTTRPDAFYGQTHVWIDPNGEYVVVKVRNEKWVVGKQVVEKIKNQYTEDVEVLRDISPEEIIGKWTQGPVVDYEVYTVPASFINSNVGSGIVYSALEDPVDFFELKKIHEDMSLIEKYGLDRDVVAKLKPFSIIKVPEMGEDLGSEIGKEFDINSPEEKSKIEAAKGELNRRVFRKGIMKDNCGECAGMTVPKCQDYLKRELPKKGDAVMFWELTDKVVSRALNECVVKVVEDQWFLDYSNEEWKKKTHKCLDGLKLYPEKARPQFDYVIDWLHEWACTRKEGLGTRLPWDDKWLIESLSDSTIYMAYYTIAHLISEFDINEIDDEFFDYIFLGKGKGNKKLDDLKKEFEYWYPVDFRNSGKDLIQNHLTFFMFNHVAIFPQKYWPKGIGVNGWVTVDGSKMSKSLGNMIPVRDVMKKFGADSSRLTILNGGEGMDDPNWESNFALSLNGKLNQIFSNLTEKKKERKEMENIDKFVLSRSQKIIKETTDYMEETMFRSAIQKIVFDYWKLIRDYLVRKEGEVHPKVFEEIRNNFIIMLSPFCPHIAEELWEKIGCKGFVSLASWPKVDEKKIDEKIEKAEEALDKTVGDIKQILKIVNDKDGKAEKVHLYVIPNEKDNFDEEELAKRAGLEIKVWASNDKDKVDPDGKAKKAKPGKPGIYVE